MALWSDDTGAGRIAFIERVDLDASMYEPSEGLGVDDRISSVDDNPESTNARSKRSDEYNIYRRNPMRIRVSRRDFGCQWVAVEDKDEASIVFGHRDRDEQSIF